MRRVSDFLEVDLEDSVFGKLDPVFLVFEIAFGLAVKARTISFFVMGIVQFPCVVFDKQPLAIITEKVSFRDASA